MIAILIPALGSVLVAVLRMKLSSFLILECLRIRREGYVSRATQLPLNINSLSHQMAHVGSYILYANCGLQANVIRRDNYNVSQLDFILGLDPEPPFLRC